MTHVKGRGMELGEILKDERGKAGLTQKQVADALDWHVSTVIRIENLYVQPTVTNVRALLALYGVSDTEFIGNVIALVREVRQRKPKVIKSVLIEIETSSDTEVDLVRKAVEAVIQPWHYPFTVSVREVRRY